MNTKPFRIASPNRPFTSVVHEDEASARCADEKELRTTQLVKGSTLLCLATFSSRVFICDRNMGSIFREKVRKNT